MPTLNATAFPAEAYVLVEVEWRDVFFRDSFSRTLVDSWGTPDVGPAYAIASGAAANFDVNGTQGTTTHTAVGTSDFIISPVALSDLNFTGQFTNTVAPTGGNFEITMIGRYVSLANYVRAIVYLLPGGGANCLIEHAQGGVFTTSATLPVPGVANTGVYRFRLVEQGSQILFRCWDASTVEPGVWHNSFTATFLTPGGVGVGSTVSPGVTNALPLTFQFDDLLAYDPDSVCPECATVTRRDTVTGEVVTLRPYVFYDGDGSLYLECCQGLWWDTEPPLNVALEYCAVGCDEDVALSQNPDFDTSTAPWTATGGVLTQDCTNAKIGLCSGRLTPTGTDANPSITQSVLTVPVAGSPVTMSTWAMSPQGWNSVFLRIVVTYTNLTSETVITPFVTLDDNEWRYLSATFTPSSTVSATTLSFVAAGVPPNTTLFNVDGLQVTQPQATTATACETVTVASESVWLKNPLHPCLDVEVGLCNPMLADCEEPARVTYSGMGDDDYAPNSVLLSPANRRRPISISRPRRDAGNPGLRLLAHNCEARDAVLDINAPGNDLLFQAPDTYCIPDRYMSVGAITESRISVDQREDFRLMVLPHVVVDRPEGPADGVCGARIRDLCDIYTSWAALAIAGLTWNDLLLGLASPSGPGQPDPPSTARTWGDVETEFANWLAVEAGGTRDWGELRDGL